MNIMTHVRAFIKVPAKFLKILIVKMTHHKGKRSIFKTAVFFLAIGYILMQPLQTIRAAFTSSFAGYMLNNLTNNTMDSISEVSS